MPPRSRAPPRVLSSPRVARCRSSRPCVAVVVVVSGITTRQMADARLSEWTDDQAVPVVAVATPDTRGQRTTIELPGRLEAYSQAQIYARVSGYIKEWKADIGTPVKAGQLLAEIDAPDLDQQIMQAQADLASAQANPTLAEATLERGQSLIASGAVSKQELDQRAADAAQPAGRCVKSSQANLDRLQGAGEIQAHHRAVRRPRHGAHDRRRRADQRRAGGGPALFVVSDTSRLRAYVNVPQNYVPSVKIGTKAQLVGPGISGQDLHRRPSKRRRNPSMSRQARRACCWWSTMPSGELMTGAFANVRLELPQSRERR